MLHRCTNVLLTSHKRYLHSNPCVRSSPTFYCISGKVREGRDLVVYEDKRVNSYINEKVLSKALD